MRGRVPSGDRESTLIGGGGHKKETPVIPPPMKQKARKERNESAISVYPTAKVQKGLLAKEITSQRSGGGQRIAFIVIRTKKVFFLMELEKNGPLFLLRMTDEEKVGIIKSRDQGGKTQKRDQRIVIRQADVVRIVEAYGECGGGFCFFEERLKELM